jgi:hypothetical protein
MIPNKVPGIRLCLVVVIFLSAMSPAPGGTEPGPSYWDAIFELGYDPVTGKTSDVGACRRIETVYEFGQLVAGFTEADRELAETYREMRERLSSLDTGNLYKMLPYKATGSSRRAIGINGRSRNNLYRISAYDPGVDQDIIPPVNGAHGSSNDLKYFGDFNFRTFISPVAKSNFRFNAGLDFYSDELPAVIIPRILASLLTVAYQQASAVAPPPERRVREFVLNQTSLRVLAGFVADFPDYSATIMRFFEIENIVSATNQSKDGSLRFDFRIRINRKAFAELYPEIHATLERLDGLIHIKGRAFDLQDRLLGYVDLDSGNDLFILQLRYLNGRLLPLDDSGRPGDAAGISLTGPGLTQLYAELDIHIDMVGLKLDVVSLTVPLDYFPDNRGLNLKVCLVQPPDVVHAGGRAFGFLPLWLIDMLIPSNVQEITGDFFQALAIANDGRGSMLEFEGTSGTEGKNHFLTKAEAEVLSNGTIKMGFNMQRRFAREQQKLIAEFNLFDEQLRKAFYRDYQRIKPSRGCR